MSLDELHALFSVHFERNDHEGATEFLKDWENRRELIPQPMTRRALCGHISDYLEGLEPESPGSYGDPSTNKWFLDTQYGYQLFHGDPF